MARFWLGTTDTDNTKTANWSASSGGAGGASVPGSSDDVTFDGNGNNACTLVANVAWNSLTTVVGYTAKLDFATFDLTMSDGGNITLDQGGEFDCGTGTISLTNGDFDNLHVTTFTCGTSTLLMSGTGNLVSNVLNDLNDLTINVGAVITATETYQILGDLIVNGSLSIANGKITFVGSGGTISIGAAGRITGNGIFRVYVPGAGEGITAFTVGGVIDVATLEIFRPNAAAVMAPGTYQSALIKVFNNTANPHTLTLSSGNYTFTGDVEVENTDPGGSLTIANDTNNPNITIQGDVIFDEQAGTITYTPGDGILTASGGNAQNWDFGAQNIEDLVVNKSADTLTFSGAWTADSFDAIDGALDFNGQTVETTGDFQIGAAATVVADADAMNGAAITVGGECDLYGVTLNATAGWTLSVTGGAQARNVTVAYCNASGGSTVQARQSTDGNNNTDWNFITAGVSSRGGVALSMSL